jgi:Mce-associated membrane protein
VTVDDAAPEVDLRQETPGDQGQTARDRTKRALAAACVGLFCLSVALAVVAAAQSSGLHDERGRRRGVEEVAGRFTTALLTYDYKNLPQARERVLALSTGNFRKEYEQAFTGGLDVLLKESRATSEGTVTNIYVGSVDEDTAEAIAVANAVAEGVSGTRRTVASYIELRLVRVSGRWRVDGVTNLNFGQGQGAAGVPTTPTTAPG